MSAGKRWDVYLIEEHELIERAMAVLHNCLEKVEEGDHDPLQLARSLDFLLEFGDKMHNVKEEQHLFPLMEAKGIPVQGGPLGVMLVEHEAERSLLTEMVAQAPGLAESSKDEVVAFKARGLEYLQVRANHIWKENDVLYPMGRKVIAEDEGAGLVRAFEALNTSTYGSAAEAAFAEMVSEMEMATGARKRLVDNLSRDQLHAILETMPVEITFVDADDAVAYFNRLDRKKVFTRSRSVVGRKVQKCHPAKSVDTVERIVTGFKDGSLDTAEFWIDMGGDKILIRYFPVRSEAGEYMGVLEVTQEIAWIQGLTGQKRLLD